MYTSIECSNAIYTDNGLQQTTLEPFSNVYNRIWSTTANNWRNVRIGQKFYTDSEYGNTYTYWTVAHINYFRSTGAGGASSPSNPMRSLILVPMAHIYYAARIIGKTSGDENLITMNSTATTGVSQNPNNPLYEITQGQEMAGYQGYYGSDMNQIYIPLISQYLNTKFDNHLTDIYCLMSDKVDLAKENPINSSWSGLENRSAWKNAPGVMIPSEYQIYGTSIFSCHLREIFPYTKFALFNFINPMHYNAWAYRFLSDVASNQHFCMTKAFGTASLQKANDYSYLYPYIVIS